VARSPDVVWNRHAHAEPWLVLSFSGMLSSNSDFAGTTVRFFPIRELPLTPNPVRQGENTSKPPRAARSNQVAEVSAPEMWQVNQVRPPSLPSPVRRLTPAAEVREQVPPQLQPQPPRAREAGLSLFVHCPSGSTLALATSCLALSLHRLASSHRPRGSTVQVACERRHLFLATSSTKSASLRIDPRQAT
jgi:hypothetical protein